MMKNSLAFCLSLISCCLSAQDVSVLGKLIDSKTKEAVFSASVAVKDSPIGTISNDEGVFQLTAPKGGIVAVSCIGYKKLTLPVTDFGDGIKNILLEPSDELLEEVIVSKIPPNELLEMLVANSKARFNMPIVLEAYYREFVKNNGKYRKFADGALDYHLSGTKKKTKSDLIVKQSRALDIVAPDEYDPTAFLSVEKGAQNSYNFAFVEIFLKGNNYKDYDWIIKLRKSADGTERMAIVITPRPDLDDPLYEGEITYDPETKLIYDMDLHMAESHKKYAKTINVLLFKLSVLDLKFKVAYKIVGNNYLLSYNNRYAKIKVWNKKRYNETMETRSDLIVTNFRKDDLSYDKKQEYKEVDLYGRGTKYTEKFWQKNNAIVLTAEEEKIIADLEKEVAK